MAVKTYPVFGGGGGGGPAEVTFPLIAPTPGAAGSEPFRFQSGGGVHGTSSGGVALSVPQGGDALALDNQGNASLAKNLTVAGLASLPGGLTAPVATLGTLTVQDNAQVGGNLGVSGAVQVAGDLSANKVTASSDLSAASLSTLGPIAGATLTVTGTATLGGLNVQGTFHATDIQSDGNFYFPTTSASAPGLALADEHATGVFGAPGTLALAVGGHAAVSFGASLKATFAAGLAAGAATFDSVATGDLTATGSVQLQNVVAQALTVAGALAAQDDVTVAGDLTVGGATRLANLVIDMLSTDHDLTVGGSANIAGALTVGGALSGTTAALQSATFSQGAEIPALTVRNFLQPLTDPANFSPVKTVPSPGGGTTAYAAALEDNGTLRLSGSLRLLGGAQLDGALAAGAGSFGGTLAAVGALSTQAGLTVGGGAQVGGALAVATRLTVGGSTFQTCHGTPNGQLTGSVGDWAIDLDAGQAYLKQSGMATQAGWVEVTTQANATGFPLLAPDSAPSAVPFAFASDAGTGMGRNGQLPLFFALGGGVVLSFATGGAARFAADLEAAGAVRADGDLSAGGDLTVAGQATLAGLQAGATTLGPLTAGDATLGDLHVGSIFSSGRAQVASTLFVGGDAEVQGLQVDGDLLAGGQATLGTAHIAEAWLTDDLARLRARPSDPTGNTEGSPGDFVFGQDGSLWIKTSGQNTTAGWSRVATSGQGVTFPLAAPLTNSPASPSYGFAGCQMGVTDGGANVLVGVTSGQAGWTLSAAGNLSVRGSVSAVGVASSAGLSAQGSITGQAISGSSLSVTGALSGGTLTAGGATLADLTATSVTTTTGSIASGQDVTAAGRVSGALVVSNGSTWRAASAAPSAGVGQAGDIASATGQDPPLWVRAQAGWRAVALTGDAAPSQFPLRGPADSASAPNYSTTLAPNTGMYFPAANQIAWSTNGVQAGRVDASGNWTLAGALAAQAATFTGLTVNGAASVTGAVQLSSTLGVAGNVTLTNDLRAANIVATSSLTTSSATVNGVLSAQSVSTTGDVTVGGNLTVNGTTTYNGVNRAGYYQVGDGTVSGPAYAFTSEPGLGWWRSAAGTLALAANGANMASFAAGLAQFAGAVRVGGTNAGLASSAANTLQVQTAGTTALAIDASQNATAAAKLTVTGLTTASGGATGPTSAWTTSVAAPVHLFGETTAPTAGTSGQLYVKASDHNLYFLSSTGVSTQLTPFSVSYPLLATPDGTATAPAYSWASETGLGWYRSAAATLVAVAAGAPLATLTTNLVTLPGALRVGGTNAGLVSAGTNQVALQVAGANALAFAASGVSSFGFQAQAVAGSAAAPGLAVGGATTGLYAGTDQTSLPFLGVAQGGNPVAYLSRTTGTNVFYGLTLGDPASTSQAAGLRAGLVTPVGNTATTGGMLYQWVNGGPGQALWVHEGTGTSNSSAWAKVLTTSSSVSPTFPLLAPSGSATAPSYSFSASSSTGFTYVPDAGNANAPAAALVANGKVCVFTDFNTANSLPVYNLVLGDPTINAAPYSASVRASAQAFVGTIIGAVGTLGINNVGGPGTVLAVKESGTGTSNGWSFVYTGGTSQLAGQNGTAAAPYFSFSTVKNAGLFLDTTTTVPAISHAGVTTASFVTNVGGNANYNAMVFGVNNTAGTPYILGIPSTAANAGNPNTNALGAYQAALLLNGAGAAGDQIWIHEPTSSSTGWVRVLTENTNSSSLRLLQTTAPAAVSNVSRLWGGTNGLVYVTNTNASGASSQPTLKQEIVGTLYGASQVITQNNNNTSICVNSASQFTLTLPAGSSTIDLCYRFQAETSAGVVVKANTGQTINNGGSVTSSAGTLSTTTNGATIELFLRAGTTTWYARGPAGTWTAA